MNKRGFVISICLCFILFMALIVGCGSLNPTSSTDWARYYPHADGAKWIYRNTAIIGTSEAYTYTASTEISGTYDIGTVTTQKYILGTVALASDTSNSTSYYVTDSTGVYYYGHGSHTTTEAQTYLPFPLENGKTWSCLLYSIEPADDFTATVIGPESVTVPLGTYNACKISYVNKSDSTWVENIWLAENVGKVKSEVRMVVYVLDPNGRTDSQTTYVATSELTSVNF